MARKYQVVRAKKSNNFSVLTTYGKNTAYFCTRESREKFGTIMEKIDVDCKNVFVIFSDTNDYVLLSSFKDKDNMNSVLVKSKVMADVQRAQLETFSHQFENI